MAARRFTPLRTDDSDLTRIQDEVARAINPALASLEALGVAPTWTAASLLNGWTYYGAPYAPPAFRKGQTAEVRSRGLITNTGAVLAGSSLWVLPAGCRPSYRLIFGIVDWSGTGPQRIDILTDGSVISYGALTAGKVFDLGNIPPFLAEQ